MARASRQIRKPQNPDVLQPELLSPRGDIRPVTSYAIAAGIAILVFAASLPDLASHYLGAAQCDMNIAYRHFIAFGVRWLKQGVIPEWNPHIFCGTPFLPSTCATLLYPPNWLPFLLLPQPLAINLCIILHAALLGVFTVHLARSVGTSNLGALLAGSIAALSPAFQSRVFAGHFTIVCTTAWIPLLFVLQQRMFARGWRGAVPFGLVAALTFLAGHLQFTYYCALMLAANLLLRTISHKGEPRGRWFLKQAGCHAFAGLIAFGCAAAEALPVIDSIRFSARSGSPDVSWIRRFSMPPENFLTFLSPALFGERLDYWGRWFWWEVCPYIGITGFTLAATALFEFVRRRRPDNLATLAVVAAFLAVAPGIPGVSDAMRFLPGWGLFRGHAKILSFTIIFGAVLAGRGLDLIGSGNILACRIASAISVALLAIGTAGAAGGFTSVLAYVANLTPVMNDRMRALDTSSPAFVAFVGSRAFSTFGFTVLWSALAAGILLSGARLRPPLRLASLLAVAIADIALFALPNGNTRFPASQPPPLASAMDFLHSKRADARGEIPGMGVVNLGMSADAESPGGNDINVSRYFDSFVAAYLQRPRGEPNLHVRFDADSPLLDAANVRYVLLSSNADVRQGAPMREIRHLDGYRVWERNTCLPRAFVVGAATAVAGDEESIVRSLREKDDFRRRVLLAGNDAREINEDFDAVAAACEYRGLHEVEVSVPRDGWLVLCDGYYPHWRATIDGADIPILRANGAFRAVRAKQGNRIVFRYSNPAFVVGAALSTATLGILAAWGIIVALRARRTLRTRC